MNTDRFTVRTVVVTLAVVVAGLAAAEVFMALQHITVPQSVDRVLNLALGALTAMLVKTSTSDDTQAVNVVNEDTDPVPVDNTPPAKK